MALLFRLGLRQASPWEPPTVLDRLLAAPLQALAYYAWKLVCWLRGGLARRLAPSSLPAAPIRVVCVSDTHDDVVAVPPGDLLIHAGDLTNHGTPASLQKELDWLAAQPHRHKVVIAGNHDTWFDPRARRVPREGLPADLPDHLDHPVFPPGLHYLEHDSITLDFGARSLSVYGAPDIPACGPDHFAFQYPRESPAWKNTVPAGVDVLVTHAPPRHHRDLGLGCGGLLAEVWRVRPRLHVFGHVHWGAGREAVCWDASQRAYEALMAADDEKNKMALEALPAQLCNLGRLLAGIIAWPTVQALFPFVQGPPNVTVFVNAAQMHGNSGRMGHNVQVLDL